MRRLLALAVAVALAGCAGSPPAPPVGPPAEEVQEVLSLLEHHQRLLAASAEEQRRELTVALAAFERSPSQFNRIRLAMVLTLPRTAWHDDARAAALLAALEPAADAAGSPRRQLAQLLQRQAAERLRWQREENRRCGAVRTCEAALRDEQKQNETLRRKLEALRDIDRPARHRGAN